jgi:hypothetical protein
MLLLSWITTSLEELLERVRELLFPEELFVSIRVDESISSFDNLLEVRGNGLEGTEQNELILDLDQEITSFIVG